MKTFTKIAGTVAAVVCIALPLTSCKSGSELESPTGFVLDENYNLTWTPVENARNYLLDIRNVVTGVTEEASSRRESLALSYLAVGDYDIRVKAVGDGSRFRDSGWSAVVSLDRAYESGCQYQLINNGSEYEIASASALATRLVLEDSYRGKPVTSIGDYAFRKANSLETLELGKNVTNIGESAFYSCAKLKSIEIPDTVTRIGKSAFQSCGFETFTVPAGITELEDSVFAYCRSLKKVDLNNVTEIGTAAFDNCSAFESFVFGDKITKIGNRVLSSAINLKEVSFGNALESVGESAFSACTALDTVHFSSAGTLRTIGDKAFLQCAFTALDLPEGLESIGNFAFMYNVKMESVAIPDSLTRIGADAFFATKFYTDQFNADNNFMYADDWLVGYSREKGEVVNLMNELGDEIYDGDYCLREGVIGIADQTFINQKALASVILPNEIKYVGAYAFARCEALHTFDAADRNSALEVLGYGAFYDCKNLQGISFNMNADSKFKVIDSYAFYNCNTINYSGQNSLIPSSVERIGTYAFFGTGLYSNPDEYGVIYADNWAIACTGEFKAGDTQNSEAKETVRLKDGTRGIGDYAFYNCKALVTVENSSQSSMQRIGKGAFYGCEKLRGFVFNDNVRTVADYAFYGCSDLRIEYLPVTIRSIGRSAFYECKSLSVVDMSDSLRLESVGDFAFYGCTNLTNVVFNDLVSEIGAYTFYGCEKLESVTIPANIKKIGASAFSRCTGLKNLILEEGVEEIGDYAFRSNVSLQAIVLPESVKRVGNSAFLQCFKVTSIDLGRVEEIGAYAFAENFGVSELVIPDSVREIEAGAFYYLGKDAEDENGNSLGGAQCVIIGGSVSNIGAHAFYGCDGTTFFVSDDNRNVDWGIGWNSSRRPVVWNVALSQDGNYVTGLTVKEDTFDFYEEINLLRAPYRAGYAFAGWSLSENGEIAYTVSDVASAPVGTVLYAVYIQL